MVFSQDLEITSGMQSLAVIAIVLKFKVAVKLYLPWGAIPNVSTCVVNRSQKLTSNTLEPKPPQHHKAVEKRKLTSTENKTKSKA